MNVQYRCTVERIDIVTRLNQDFHSDLFWWYTFISGWNGLSILRNPNTDAQLIIVFRLMFQFLWGVVLVGIITGFSGRSLRVRTSGNNGKGVT